ncbi:hypothetical protein, partial [Bradyrhizobium sp.]|uniref:hypothetical protein n=1 Tax=Bradyrhizobium sp. TaxID=376 RepID=UPI003C774FE8
GEKLPSTQLLKRPYVFAPVVFPVAFVTLFVCNFPIAFPRLDHFHSEQHYLDVPVENNLLF